MGDILGVSATTVFLIVCLVMIIGWWVQQRRNPKTGLPRVPDIPLLGSLFWVGSLQEFSEHVGKSFYGLTAKYGQVFYFKLIGVDMVVVNGYKNVKEVLTSTDMAGRPEVFQLLKKHQNTLGILDGDFNEDWKEQRKFSLQNLKLFGFGKRSFEGHMIKEVECLTKQLKTHKSQPFDFRHYAATCTANIICVMVFGQRFEYTDKKFQVLNETLCEYFDVRAQPPIGELQKYLSWLPTATIYRKKVIALSKKLLDFCEKRIEEHQQTFDPENLRDYVDGYLHDIMTNPNSKCSVEQLKRIIFELFIGGSETTSTVLQWAVIILANHQHVQDRVKAELETVFGDESPSLYERHRLPYTDAVILEIQRYACVLTLTPFHKALKDTEIAGYPVPKDTTIAVNLYSVLYDAELFPEPEVFRPERFLTDDMKFVRNEKVIAFGLGTRVCLGQQLAKQELFLLVTNLVHRFRITPPPGVDAVPTDGQTRITYRPKPFEICAKPYQK